MRLRRALPLLLLFACGEEEKDASLPCDVRQRACQSAVFRAAAESREQDGAEMPSVRVITRDQLADELRRSLDQSQGEESPAETLLSRQKQSALALLGLMPEPSEQSADDAYIAQSVATIAAYYSHTSHDVTVIADQAENRDDATITLAHEFVHALQDQREGLSRLQAKYSNSSDEQVSFTSLVEGEATWLSYVTYYREAMHVDYAALDHERAFKTILDRTLKSMRDSDAPLLDASELLPYPVGGEFVARFHLAQGLSELSALFEAPPLTLRAYVDDDYGDPLPRELGCEAPAAPADYEQVSSDRLGFAGLLAFVLASDQTESVAFDAARAWRADELITYAPTTAASEQEEIAVAWSLTLDSPASAGNLLALIAGHPNLLFASVRESSLLISTASDLSVRAAFQPTCEGTTKSRAHSPTESLAAELRRRRGIMR